MKVFKTCMKIIVKNKLMFSIYCFVFLGLCSVIAAMNNEQIKMDFSEEKPEYTVIDRDTAHPFTEGMKKYLEKKGTPVELKDRKKELQDAQFYGKTDYILVIPNGFGEAFGTDRELPLEVISGKNTSKIYYMESLTQQYWDQIRLISQLHPKWDEEQTVGQVLEDLALQVSIEKYGIGKEQERFGIYQEYNRMQGYIFIVLIILLISQVQMVFRRLEIRMRNLVSPMRPRTQSIQMALHGLVTGSAVWAAFTLLGILLYAKPENIGEWKVVGMLAANGYCLMLASMALALLVSQFVRNVNVMNMAANLLALALGFLGGVFVPLEMLSKEVIAVGKLFPTYWYADNVRKICSLSDTSLQSTAFVWQNCGILILFAAAIFAVSLLLGKYRSMGEEEYGSVRTEVEN